MPSLSLKDHKKIDNAIFFSFFNVLLETGNILMLCLLCEPYASTFISKIYHVFGQNIFIEVRYAKVPKHNVLQEKTGLEREL